MTEYPIFRANSVPGLGSVEVYAGGNVRLADDSTLTHDQVNHLFSTIADVRAVIRHCKEVRELKRPVSQTSELATIADQCT